jgi:hypothetical protein
MKDELKGSEHGQYPGIFLEGLRKIAKKASVSITGVPGEVRTGHFPNVATPPACSVFITHCMERRHQLLCHSLHGEVLMHRKCNSCFISSSRTVN